MKNHEKPQLRDPEVTPTCDVLEQALGVSYAAYEALQEALPGIEIEQAWQWYTPHKTWAAKGQHFWTTKKGTRKEKNLYWLYVCDGYFNVAVWFKEKDREEVLMSDVSEKTKKLIRNAETMGKLPTFPVVFEVTTAEPLSDIYELLDRKKKLEK